MWPRQILDVISKKDVKVKNILVTWEHIHIKYEVNAQTIPAIVRDFPYD